MATAAGGSDTFDSALVTNDWPGPPTLGPAHHTTPLADQKINQEAIKCSYFFANRINKGILREFDYFFIFTFTTLIYVHTAHMYSHLTHRQTHNLHHIKGQGSLSLRGQKVETENVLSKCK